jgi:hypothetical protein
MDTILLKNSSLTENSHIYGFTTQYCNYLGKVFVKNMKSDFSRKSFYMFERKVSRTLVGSESGLQIFMKIVFLGILSCGVQSFMLKIIRSS